MQVKPLPQPSQQGPLSQIIHDGTSDDGTSLPSRQPVGETMQYMAAQGATADCQRVSSLPIEEGEMRWWSTWYIPCSSQSETILEVIHHLMQLMLNILSSMLSMSRKRRKLCVQQRVPLCWTRNQTQVARRSR